uniref:RNA-directed RNA polymerase n=1 Tax=Alternaria alternata victorivirus 1 TaxID=2572218 RepID=A0A4Y1SHC3_9VIRU|nr:RNA dependent RNA polymerase [Alternaria alternata victorivirus 1]
MTAFPPKNRAMSITKANMFLDEVARDCWRVWPGLLQQASPYLARLRDMKATHDQATAYLLYSVALSHHTIQAFRWAFYALSNPKGAKEVSNFLKAVGGNASSFGSLLVETDTLQGRDTPGTNLAEDAKKRTNLGAIKNDMLAEFDDDLLRSAVRRVIDLELAHPGEEGYQFPTLADHWSSRWNWSVNGSHSALVGREIGSLPYPKERISKMHRRAWLECVEEDPRVGWDGHTYVSANPKLECGKTRAIYACDTRSYLAFEHLLATVERNWRGSRVILNPGRGGHIGMAERVARNRRRCGISLMLDYDDFNSHHTTRAMQIVIEETCSATSYPPDLAAPLIASLGKQDIYLDGKFVGRSAGTLMSGHRGTTYFNSVLNMAYLMCVLGEDYILARPSLHVGDDVYMGATTYTEVGHIVETVMASRLRMNPTKQSVGHVSTEFLRVASDARDSYGYLARAVATTVAGNWYTDRVLNPFEALTTMVTAARTLANRARSNLVPLLLGSAVKRVLGPDSPDDTMVDEILCGGLAINNGPVFSSGGTLRAVTVEPTIKSRDNAGYQELPCLSSNEFLSKCASPLETTILSEAGISVKKQMVMSSWSKSVNFRDADLLGLRFGTPTSHPAIGSVSAESLIKTRAPSGVLTKYPLLVLAKGRLPETALRVAVAAAGGNPNAPDIMLEAWGEYKHGCIVNTVLSYSDAAALSVRTACSVLTSTRRCYV